MSARNDSAAPERVIERLQAIERRELDDRALTPGEAHDLLAHIGRLQISGLNAYRELRRVEAVRANSERVAHKALALAEEVYGWAVHEPNHHRLLRRLAELREELRRGA